MNSVATADAAAEQITYSRQRDWFNPTDHQDSHVMMVGCGGIGSFTALALAKLGVSKLTLIDPDVVEPHNIPNQFFSQAYTKVGMSSWKTDRLKDELASYSPTEVTSIVDAVTADSMPVTPEGVVVSALDSMEARSNLWRHLKLKIKVPLLLDARLGGENIVLYSCKPTDPLSFRAYEETLYSDEEAQENVCSRQSIIDVGFAVASLITRAVRRHYAGLEVEAVTYQDQQNLTILKGN